MFLILTRMNKHLLSFLIILLGGHAIGQTIAQFSYTSCLNRSVIRKSEFINIKKRGKKTVVQFTTHAPCNGDFAGGVEINQNILNLMFWTKPTQIQLEENALEVTEVAECDCFFTFTYHLNYKFQGSFDSIRINGLTLQEMDANQEVIELE
jgi:hypothetical protein